MTYIELLRAAHAGRSGARPFAEWLAEHRQGVDAALARYAASSDPLLRQRGESMAQIIERSTTVDEWDVDEEDDA